MSQTAFAPQSPYERAIIAREQNAELRRERRQARRDSLGILSREDKREIAHDCGVVRCQIDSGSWGYAIPVPCQPDIFDPKTNPGGSIQNMGDAVSENGEWLLQEARKREQKAISRT